MRTRIDQRRRQRLLRTPRTSQQPALEYGRLAGIISRLHQSAPERAVVMIRQYLHAAELCIKHGEVSIARKLLVRAYRSSTRHEIARMAARAAKLRVQLEHIVRNSVAIRLWTARYVHWHGIEAHQYHLRQRYEHLVRAHVFGTLGRMSNSHIHIQDHYCDDLRLLVLPYLQCSRGRYDLALEQLNSNAVHASRSIFLADEVRWLRFRMSISEQQYDRAQLLYEEMKHARLGTSRLYECQLLAKATLEIIGALNTQEGVSVAFSRTVTTFVHGFDVMRQQGSGLYINVLVYELVRLLLAHDYAQASRRLSALRVRLSRLKLDAAFEELRVFLQVVKYMLSTSHRLKRPFPTELMKKFHAMTPNAPYIQQGIIPYSELAYRLLMKTGYR